MIGCSRIPHGHAVRWFCLPFFLAAWASMSAPSPAMAEPATPAEFSRLSEEDQLAYLKEALLEFRRRTENVSASVIESATNLEYDPATREIGRKVLTRGSTFEYDLRRIGDSYRVSRHRETHGRKEPGVIYDITDVEGYDAQAGRRHQYGIAPREDGSSLLGGLISPHRSKKITANCLFYQYLGDTQPDGDVPLCNAGSRFLSGFDDARVPRLDVDAGLVEVRCPGTMPWGTPAECRMVFNLNNGALLTRHRLIERPERADGKERWNDLEVLDVHRIGAVWVPIEMRVTGWSSGYPRQVTVRELTIKDAQLGTLTDADLEVVFPPGTEVRDEFTGTRFKVGPNGEELPSRIKEAHSVAATNAAVLDEHRNRTWFIIGNVVLLMGVVAARVFIVRRRAS